MRILAATTDYISRAHLYLYMLPRYAHPSLFSIKFSYIFELLLLNVDEILLTVR